MTQNQEPEKHDAYDLRKLFEEIELNLIQNLRRNLKRHEREEEKEGFRWEMWQKAKFRNLWKYRKENQKIVGNHSKEIEEIINKTLQGNFDTAESILSRLINKVKSFFSRRGIRIPKNIQNNGLSKSPRPEKDFFGVNKEKIEALQETATGAAQTPAEKKRAVSEPEDSPASLPPAPEKSTFRPEGKEKNLTGSDNDQKLYDLKKQVNKDMLEAQSAVWRRMDDIYRQTIYKAEMFMAAGTKTLDQAIDMATKEFLEAGINCIEYRNGRRVNIASYAEMALRTASQRAVLLAEGKKRDEWGIHTVVVSAHANTCPLCAPWQGKVFVDDVFSHGTAEDAQNLKMSLLSTAIRAGLLHPNCRHTISTYFPGITRLPAVPDSERAIKTYEAEQQQRALERKIRKWKRIAAGSMEPEKVNLANDKVKEYQKALREHLLKHPELRREYNREKTRGLTEQFSGKVSEARADKLFYIVTPPKGDAIKAHSLYKNLNKSAIGKETIEYIEQNNIDVEITYSDEVGDGLRGRVFGRHVEVYGRNTVTIKDTAKAIVHEITHLKYGVGNDQHAETLCHLRELEHEKGTLTSEDVRDTINYVKRLYPDYPWRER